LIGTHAALSDKVSFSALGLAIIDEQQLFGVRQREELIEKGPSVDFLMMSATPIPRTLSQIIHSDVSVSTLLAFPHGQRNVKTGVVRSTDPIIDQAVKKAIAAHRQVFVVAPKIEEGTKKNSSFCCCRIPGFL
jgi:ATP-dependent DNA helicase RecG